MSSNRLFKLSPSSFSFLYEGCKRCFYLDVVHGMRQPSIPLPGIFSTIASLLKTHYNGRRTKELYPVLPEGVVTHGEKYVKSKIIKFPNHKNECFISGRFDIVTSFEDGSYGVIDFKTGNHQSDHDILYERQLRAYSFALENPAEGAFGLTPISKLGLLYFPPVRTKQDSVDRLLYESEIQWVEIEKDDEKFLNFLDEVMGILDSDKLPEPSPDCKWCNYFNKLKGFV